MHRLHKLQKLTLYTLQIQQILRIELGGNLNRRNDEETGLSSATAENKQKKGKQNGPWNRNLMKLEA